jgi:hypothetical protein
LLHDSKIRSEYLGCNIGSSADFQDLSPRGFHNHSPTIFTIIHPPFS